MFRRKPLSVAVQQAFSTFAIAATATAPNIALGQETLEEVVVTGSRIAGDANLVTSSPVTQIKAEEIGYRGITRVEDLLNDLPQIVPDLTANESNGATGTATIDLRGLGGERTLVLTNGHRMGFGDPAYTPVDINQVPGALVERVEILTGGASSTYGSDAVAGVVNFIMKDDFEGVQIDYQYAAYQHSNDNDDMQDEIDGRAVANPTEFVQAPGDDWGGGTHDINIIFGVNSPDGRGNITGYLGYRDTNALLQKDRDFTSCALDAQGRVSTFPNVDNERCAGSATSATGLFTDFTAAYYTVSGTTFVPGVPSYNYGPLNHFQRPDERYTAGMFAHYEVNEHFEPYAEFQFMDDQSDAQIAPSGAFFVTSTISCDNPFLSAQQLGVMGCAPGASVPWYIGRRNVEGGPRFDDLRHTTYRIMGGVRGQITEDWTYDANANFNRLIYGETYQNDMSTTRIVRALDAVIDPATGLPACRSAIPDPVSGVVVDANCVPYNVFQTGGVTQAAIDYLTLPLFSDARLTQDQYTGFVSGDLTSAGVISPWATDGVKLVVGGEYRDEQIDYNTDSNFQSGDGAGQGGSTVPIEGGIDVWELFFETKIPIVQDREWIESLTLDAGYRYSDYSTGVDTDTWKTMGEWTPVTGFKFRGGYSRAVRHANLIELFQPGNSGLWGGVDPCGGTTPVLTQAQCLNSGFPAAAYGTSALSLSPAGQYNGVFSGNDALVPERANTFTVGAVFNPEEYVPGLQFSVDYWSIEIKDAIDDNDAEFVITQCGVTADPAFCGLINRNPVTGALWTGNVVQVPGTQTFTGSFVDLTRVNLGFLDVAGIDLIGGYSREIGNYGSLDFTFRGTVTTKWDQQVSPGAPVDDCKGEFGGSCGRPKPAWKHNFMSVWTTPWDLVFVGAWRMVGAVDEFNPNTAANSFGPADAGAEHYFDLTAEYTPQFIGIGETKFTVGVTNLTDNDPPVSGRFGNIATYGNGNTVPGTWDATGRYFFFALSQKF